ncbi:site-specific integrase [Pseudomonas sp.]|uniref:tyrosine-type recombinase/integrase n=1 Tax=Pseudomonas sp. TaxID=306 RepID=UPI00261A959C|nr:site-specific integrase [Pseudomonas sp.]
MGKATGPHREKRLSAVSVRATKDPGRYADGNGLYLIVDPSGAKRWVLRINVQEKRRDIGLGGLSVTTLAEARETALEYRKIARNGGDPVAIRRQTRVVIPTFEAAARTVHAEHSTSWANAKHADQWINTLTTYVFPKFGDLPVDRINTPEILGALAPIWLTKPETAKRVRQRIGTVLDWSKAAGFRTGDNPIDSVSKGLPKQPGKDEHHEALPYAELPAFLQSLRKTSSSELATLAFEFLILNASRTGEVLLAKWSEVDLSDGVWTIPASRMKAKREHRIPLTPTSIELLTRAKALADDSDYIFPGRDAKKPMSNMVFLMILRRMGLTITAHGFRSSFRDWASEQTTFSRDACEMALAHTIKDKVEAAYRRGDLFEKRRDLMLAWAAFAASVKESHVGDTDLNKRDSALPLASAVIDTTQAPEAPI